MVMREQSGLCWLDKCVEKVFRCLCLCGGGGGGESVCVCGCTDGFVSCEKCEN